MKNRYFLSNECYPFSTESVSSNDPKKKRKRPKPNNRAEEKSNKTLWWGGSSHWAILSFQSELKGDDCFGDWLAGVFRSFSIPANNFEEPVIPAPFPPGDSDQGI